MKRYSIMVLPAFTKTPMELCQVETDPDPIMRAARLKTMPGTKGLINRYERVWLVDRGELNRPEYPQDMSPLTEG
jgi:hypothetical protein